MSPLSPSSPPPPPPSLLTPPSWITDFRDVYNDDKHFAKFWLWDNLKWDQHSIWIGKLDTSCQLPDDDQVISQFLHYLVDDLNQYPEIKSQVYLKFYFSRNIETRDPEINYLLL